MTLDRNAKTTALSVRQCINGYKQVKIKFDLLNVLMEKLLLINALMSSAVAAMDLSLYQSNKITLSVWEALIPKIERNEVSSRGSCAMFCNNKGWMCDAFVYNSNTKTCEIARLTASALTATSPPTVVKTNSAYQSYWILMSSTFRMS